MFEDGRRAADKHTPDPSRAESLKFLAIPVLVCERLPHALRHDDEGGRRGTAAVLLSKLYKWAGQTKTSKPSTSIQESPSTRKGSDQNRELLLEMFGPIMPSVLTHNTQSHH